MPLRLLTPSPVTRLVSLSEFKTELGESGSTNDARYTRTLNAVSRAFAEYLGWPLPRQRYTETASGTGRLRLVLSARPVDADSFTITVDDIAVAAADFTIEDAAQGVLYKASGWAPASCRPGEPAEANIAATYKAGWVLPAQIVDYADALALAAGTWLRPAGSQTNPYLLEVTTAGTTSGATEPTWDLTPGDTTTAGTAILTTRDATELPPQIYEVALITAKQWVNGGLELPTGIESESADGFRVSYDTQAARAGASPLPTFARSVLDSYR